VSEDMSNKKCILKIKNNTIPYTIVKTRRRKTIGIIIDRNGEVKVHVPYGAAERQIYEVVQKKADWIIEKVNEVKERNSNLTSRQYISGEKLLYLGKEYTLEVVEKDLKKAGVHLNDNTMEVHISGELSGENRKKAIKEALIKWYRERMAEIVKERIDKYALQLKVFPCKVVIKDQKTRWGSCSEKGNINLNWRLIMAPLHIIDYVIVHEMCHLKVMNHSKDFWTLVESVLPDYRESRKWVKVNGNRLEI